MSAPEWSWSDDYSTAYRETTDPRVLEIIVRDDSGDSQPDGDALAPAYWTEFRGEWRDGGRAGSTFDDDAFAAYLAARNRVPFHSRKSLHVGSPKLNSHDFATRFMRIFHDTAIVALDTRDGSQVILLNTPTYRTHVGIELADGTRALNGAGEPIADEVALSLEGECSEFRAWLDGDVFGVGHAINMARVMPGSEIVLEDFEQEIECWGFFGEEYAKGSLQDFDMPALDALLNLPSEVTA